MGLAHLGPHFNELVNYWSSLTPYVGWTSPRASLPQLRSLASRLNQLDSLSARQLRFCYTREISTWTNWIQGREELGRIVSEVGRIR